MRAIVTEMQAIVPVKLPSGREGAVYDVNVTADGMDEFFMFTVQGQAVTHHLMDLLQSGKLKAIEIRYEVEPD